jgi:hypothetical protein
MYETLNGTATLTSLDAWMTRPVECGARRHLTVAGIADDQPGLGNKLSFAIADLDQTFLPPIIDRAPLRRGRIPCHRIAITPRPGRAVVGRSAPSSERGQADRDLL